jgi:hypothetical protein
MDWSDVEDNSTKPIYIRKQDWVPCGCMRTVSSSARMALPVVLTTTRRKVNNRGHNLACPSAPSNEPR